MRERNEYREAQRTLGQNHPETRKLRRAFKLAKEEQDKRERAARGRRRVVG